MRGTFRCETEISSQKPASGREYIAAARKHIGGKSSKERPRRGTALFRGGARQNDVFASDLSVELTFPSSRRNPSGAGQHEAKRDRMFKRILIANRGEIA